jgi:serine/threonine protein kinase
MEFCGGGDLESYVRKKQVLEIEEITSIFFQMCFSLYACRDQISLRHYDIKLLNYFCTNYMSINNMTVNKSIISHHTYDNEGHDVHGMVEKNDEENVNDMQQKSIHLMQIYFGTSVFSIPLEMNTEHYGLIKLADFGTSVCGSSTLGCPIDVNQVCYYHYTEYVIQQ